MKTTSRHKHPHFHTSVVELGELVYDYTDTMPTEAIKQAGALLAMIDGNDFRKVCVELANYFLKAQQHGFHDQHYMLIGEFMGEGIFKCYKPCYISPSMN